MMTSNPRTRRRSRGLLALMMALSLVAAACGSDSTVDTTVASAPDAAATTATTAAAGSTQTTAAAPAEPVELFPVTIAVNNPILNPIISAIWIGKYFGWYEEEGIDLSDPVGTQGAGDTTQRIAARQVDFGPPPPSIILSAAAEGRPLPVISVFNWRRTGQYQFAVPVGSDITALADIEGKTIGVSNLGDEGVFYAKAALRELGLDDENADIIAVGAAGQAAEAMNQNQVDVLALPGAQYALLETLGVEVQLLPQPEFAKFIFGNHIVTHRDFIVEHPEIVGGYLRAFTKSTIFFIENPEAAIRVSYEMYPETVPSGLTVDEAVAKSLLTAPAMIATLDFSGKVCQQFGCSEQGDWEAYAEYVNADVPDVTEFYTNEFVEFANDFDQVAFAEWARNYQPGDVYDGG